MSQRIAGVDIGGSHITAALVDLDNGNIVNSRFARQAVNSGAQAEDIIIIWSNVIKKVFDTQSFDNKVGIAMPGPFDYSSGISLMENQDKYDSLYELNVRNLLADKLGIFPNNIRFINDAESFLKGEVFSGAAAGKDKAIGITLGTGLGSARLHYGKTEDANLWCSSFLEGIAEDYLSTRWFVSRYQILCGTEIKGVKELSDLAADDMMARQVFNEFGKNLASFLKPIINKEQPECIVIGGNISNAFELFSESLMTGLQDLRLAPVITKALLGEQSALIGAASTWHKKESKILQAAHV
ncbi:MAG: transcriptional regulator/sugar kinase [Chitinophagaceae bacterium]|nr:transcriptional regulator/sugar kinase [Chitinophagaceae bacterium]